MNRRNFLASAGLTGAAAAMLTAARPAAAQELNWRMANLYPRGLSFGPAYGAFSDSVGAMSGGRLTVETLYDGEGVGATEILSATRSGLVEMGAPYMALHAGELPAGLIELGLPGGPTRFSQLFAMYRETEFGSVLREAYEAVGLHHAGPYLQPGVYLITKEPIASVEDLKGLTLRSPGAYGSFMEKLGAKPVVMAFSEGYTSLATGVIDGAASSNLIDYRDGAWYEQAPYICPHPVTGAQGGPLVVNKGRYDSLPDDLKAIIDSAGVVHGLDQASKSTAWVAGAVSEMLSKGMKWGPTFSDADLAKWKEASDATLDEYASGDDDFSKRLIAIQREYVATLGG